MTSTKSTAATRNSPVPMVDFYKDADSWPTSDLVHSEPLAERSQLHDWRIHPHRHRKLTQLFFLQKGHGTARVDSIVYDVSAPCVLMVPERCVHEFEWAKDSAGFVLSITSVFIGDLSMQIGDNGNVFSKHAIFDTSTDTAYVELLFARIQHEFDEPLSSQELSLDCLIRLLALWLARRTVAETTPAGTSSRASRHFARFRKLVDEHHKSHWSVSRYANAVGITPSHLNAVCHRVAGKSALEAVHERLLLAARRNLVYTEKTIAGVSHSLGFADPSYFTRFFRRHTGLAPGQFRRQSGTITAGRGRASPPTSDHEPAPQER